MNEKQMIQQHYYTYSEKGLLSNKEGLDTVAKSSGLDAGFIERYLHPICHYSPSKELLARKEEDEEVYPKSLTVLHTDEGDVVMSHGNQVGVPTTSEASNYFIHNIVIPKSQKEIFITQGNPLFRSTQFKTSYMAEEGTVLPELMYIEHNKDSHYEGASRIIEQIKMTDPQLKQLFKAIVVSILNKQTVYLSLQADILFLPYYANRLTEILYHILPYHLRRLFGFSTYQAEVKPIPNVHLIVVEKNSLATANINRKNTYLFDLNSQSILYIDKLEMNDVFLNYVWKNKWNIELLKEFFVFLDQALFDATDDKLLSYDTLIEITQLFKILKEDYTDYDKNKEVIFNSILSYLDKDNYIKKVFLRNLFLKLLRKESENKSDLGYTATLIHTFLVFSQLNETSFEPIVVKALINSIKMYPSARRSVYLLKLIEEVNMYDTVLELLFIECDKHEAVLYELIIDIILGEVSDVHSFIEVLEYWSSSYPPSLTHEKFKLKVTELLNLYLVKGKVSFSLVKSLLEQLERLNRVYELEGRLKYIEALLLDTLFRNINLHTLNYEELLIAVPVVEVYSTIMDKLPLNRHSGVINYEVCEALVLTLKTGEEAEKQLIQVLKRLNTEQSSYFQNNFTRMVKENCEQFPAANIKYIYGLSVYKSKNEISKVLSFISRVNAKFLYDYIEKEAQFFLNSQDALASLGQYLEKTKDFYDNDTLYSRMIKNLPSELVQLFESIKLKHLNPLVRVVIQKKKAIVLSLAIILGSALIAGLVLMWLALSNNDAKEAFSEQEEITTIEEQERE